MATVSVQIPDVSEEALEALAGELVIDRTAFSDLVRLAVEQAAHDLCLIAERSPIRGADLAALAGRLARLAKGL